MSKNTKLTKVEVVLARIKCKPGFVAFTHDLQGYALTMTEEVHAELGEPSLVTVTVEPGARPGWGAGPVEAYDGWVTE